MSRRRRYPVYTAHAISADGESCGHQHSTHQAAANCAQNRAAHTHHDHHVCERGPGTRRYAGTSIVTTRVLITPPK